MIHTKTHKAFYLIPSWPKIKDHDACWHGERTLPLRSGTMELKASFEKLKDMELQQNEWYLPQNLRSDAASKDITSAWEEGQAAPSSPPKDEGGKAGSSTDVHEKEAEPEVLAQQETDVHEKEAEPEDLAQQETQPAASKDITSAWDEDQAAPSSPPKDEGGKVGSSTDGQEKEAELEDPAQQETQPAAAGAPDKPSATDEEDDDDDDEDEDDEEGEEEEEKEDDHVVEDGPSPKRKKIEAPAAHEPMHEDKEVMGKGDKKEEQEKEEHPVQEEQEKEEKESKAALSRTDQQLILTWLHRRTSAKKCTPAAKEEALAAKNYFGTLTPAQKVDFFNKWKDNKSDQEAPLSWLGAFKETLTKETKDTSKWLRD